MRHIIDPTSIRQRGSEIESHCRAEPFVHIAAIYSRGWCSFLHVTNDRSIDSEMRGIIHFFSPCLDRAPRVINSPWFIGLIVSLIVLVIVIAIVCGIMKRKGGKYSGRFRFCSLLIKPSDTCKTHSHSHLRNVHRYHRGFSQFSHSLHDRS